MPKVTSPRAGVGPDRPPLYIAIDPGMSGAIAFLQKSPVPRHKDRWTTVLHTVSMPEDKEDIFEFIHCTLCDADTYEQPVIYMEQLTGHAGPSSRNTGSSSFKLGRNVGDVRMAVRASVGYFPQEIFAGTWQKGVDIPSRTKDEKKADFKRRLKARAVELFGDVRGLTVTLKNCDAMLIAEYAWRVHNGLVQPPRTRPRPKAKRKRRRRPHTVG